MPKIFKPVPMLNLDTCFNDIELDAETKEQCNKLRAKLATALGFAQYKEAAKLINVSSDHVESK